MGGYLIALICLVLCGNDCFFVTVLCVCYYNGVGVGVYYDLWFVYDVSGLLVVLLVYGC